MFQYTRPLHGYSTPHIIIIRRVTVGCFTCLLYIIIHAVVTPTAPRYICRHAGYILLHLRIEYIATPRLRIHAIIIVYYEYYLQYWRCIIAAVMVWFSRYAITLLLISRRIVAYC